MKILLGGDCDQGGGSYWLADVINKYTPHQARAVRTHQNFLAYPYDILGPTQEEMDVLVRWADVIHIRRSLSGLDLRGISSKGRVITYTGSTFRKGKPTVYKAKRKGWTICVSTPDMMGFCKDLDPIWLPNPREDLSHLWDPAPSFRFFQSPTGRLNKQTALFLDAAEAIGAEVEIVENAPYHKCLERKRHAHAVLDQIAYGSGSNAIEGWALGMPVVSGFGPVDARFRQGYLDTCGWLPFAEVKHNLESVKTVLQRLRDDRAYYEETQEKGREAFWQFYHAPVVAWKAIQTYEQALGVG